MAGSRIGRPRDPKAHAAILVAVRDLLAANGYERLTIEAVAAQAGVGKQTVYRWWPSKAALVAEAALTGYVGTRQDVPPPTGDLGSDVRDWLVTAFAGLADPTVVALVRALAAAAADRDVDADRLYALLTGPSRDQLVARLEAGTGGGRVASDVDLGVVADTLVGAVLYRVLARLAQPTDQDIDTLVALITNGIGPGAPARPRPRRNPEPGRRKRPDPDPMFPGPRE